jgi:hypothetical protein
MTGVLMVYSGLFMRFAWMVKPRNYLLLACHASNSVAQTVQMGRRMQYEWDVKPAAAVAAVTAVAAKDVA